MTEMTTNTPATTAPPGAAPPAVAGPDTGPPGKARVVTLTSKAIAMAKSKLEKRGTPDASLRLGIRGAGCSGYTYVIEFHDGPPNARDHVFEFDGLRVVIDKKSMIYLAGSQLDWQQTVMQQGFKFLNPQEASSCGCGHSFTVK